jgi:hypothetical protein
LLCKWIPGSSTGWCAASSASQFAAAETRESSTPPGERERERERERRERERERGLAQSNGNKADEAMGSKETQKLEKEEKEGSSSMKNTNLSTTDIEGE